MPLPSDQKNKVVALGKFDALHLGHRALVERARDFGQPYLLQLNGMAEALGWSPRAPLLDDQTRSEVLADWRAGVLCLPFADVRPLSAEEFLTLLVEQHQVSALVCGANCRIGRDRHADARWLLDHGPRWGLRVAVIPLLVGEDLTDPPVPAGGSDVREKSPVSGVSGVSGKGAVVSSTLIRDFLAEGAMASVEAALGRPYRLRGVVIRGDQRGQPSVFLPQMWRVS